jgi:predicted DNA-binding transcriptional regulator YafY
MRADRLVAAFLLLQARGRVTAAELAEEVEVSVKTARRDLESLSAAGLPVYAQPGRGGGWQLLDPAGWGGGAPPPASPHLEALQRAIRAVTLTERPAFRPPGFDLAQAWGEAVADVDARRARAQAVVLASQAAAEGLLFQFGGDARVGDRRPDGRLDVHIGGASTLQLAERLAGWGTAIEVARPPELRRQLAEIGAQLVQAYAEREASEAPPVVGTPRRSSVADC